MSKNGRLFRMYEQDELLKAAKKAIPSLDAILAEAVEKLRLNEGYVKERFGEVLVLLDGLATDIFRNYEKNAMLRLSKGWLTLQKDDIRRRLEEILDKNGWDEFIDEASQLFVEFGGLVQRLEKDLGNMRKARGGRTFERMILNLLDFIGVSGEIPKGKAGEELKRIDIVIPSIDVASKTPDRAIFLTCKRTLRERWKQEVPQARLNQRIYLLTIDESLSGNKAKEIDEKGFIAFVRDDLKDSSHLNDMPWIRKLSDLPKELERV
jgi:hypothetical protein